MTDSTTATKTADHSERTESTFDPTQDTGAAEILSELRAWLGANWDPDLTVGEWWERLGLAGWSAPGLPETPTAGAGAGRRRAGGQQEIAAFGALGRAGGLGLLLAAPTIATHGTQEQIDHYVRDIVTGQQGLVPVVQRARGRVGPGRPADAGRCATATSGSSTVRRSGHRAASSPTWACCWPGPTPTCPSTRASPTSPSTCTSPGVDVRPLREMTGHALFNEVFITDARVPDAALIGGVNNGWAVANTTLMNERAGLGAGGGTPPGDSALPAPWPAPGHGGPATSSGRGGGAPAGAAVRMRSRERRRRQQRCRARSALMSGGAGPLIRAGQGNGTSIGSRRPPGPGPPLHPERARPVQRPPAQGGPGVGRGHPGLAQHRQALHEPHRAADP